MIALFFQTMSDAFDVRHFYIHCGSSLLLWLLVFCVVMIDLWDGIYTARKLKQPVRSHRLRATFAKFGEYWRIMLFGFIADTIGVMFPFYSLPYLSMLICLGIIAIEFRSVLEHSKKRKSKSADLPDIIGGIIDAATEHDAISMIKKLDDFRLDQKKSEQ